MFFVFFSTMSLSTSLMMSRAVTSCSPRNPECTFTSGPTPGNSDVSSSPSMRLESNKNSVLEVYKPLNKIIKISTNYYNKKSHNWDGSVPSWDTMILLSDGENPTKTCTHNIATNFHYSPKKITIFCLQSWTRKRLAPLSVSWKSGFASQASIT